MVTKSTIQTLQGCHGDDKYGRNVHRDVMVTTNTVEMLMECHGGDRHGKHVTAVL